MNTDERRLNESVSMERLLSPSSHPKPQREGARLQEGGAGSEGWGGSGCRGTGMRGLHRLGADIIIDAKIEMDFLWMLNDQKQLLQHASHILTVRRADRKPRLPLFLKINKPQMNTDERRFNESVSIEKVLSAPSHPKPQREGARLQEGRGGVGGKGRLGVQRNSN